MTELKYQCITEYDDAHGYYWRYDHSADEPRETLITATAIACNFASHEAHKRGKSYVVATTMIPPMKIYMLPLDHPEFSAFMMAVVITITPDGERIDGPWIDPKYWKH